VIIKPRERRGHSPRCAARPEKIIIIIINTRITYVAGWKYELCSINIVLFFSIDPNTTVCYFMVKQIVMNCFNGLLELQRAALLNIQFLGDVIGYCLVFSF
jgi:hypothetical protein